MTPAVRGHDEAGETGRPGREPVVPAAVAALDEERRAITRLRWYMLLRWLGVAALYTAGTVAREVGDYPISASATNVLAPLVLAYNVVVWRLVRRWTQHPPADWRRRYRLLGNGQCAADLIVLSIGLHYGGGIESYVLFEPLAVVVVAGLVLSARDSFLQGIFACVLVDVVVVGEATGRIDHVDIGQLQPELITSARFVASIVVLHNIITLLVAFVVVFIAQNLRAREAELTHLYGQEREAVERLHELDNLKSSFLSTVSHELRTPLTVIRGLALTLGRHWEGMEDRLRKDQVSTIERQSERLHRLVENLLDLSALEAGHITVRTEDVDLASIASSAVASCGVDGVELDVPAGLRVIADPNRTEQVLVNLLDNARKYGSPPITVAAIPDGERVVVSVTDRGPGVPADRAITLFDRFAQLDHDPSRPRSGVGLGLALVKGYVEGQGGEVWHEDVPGGGSRFAFTLPVVVPEPKDPFSSFAAGSGEPCHP